MVDYTVHIQVADKAITVSGDQNLLDAYSPELDFMRVLLRGSNTHQSQPSTSSTSAPGSVAQNALESADFGELMIGLPNSVTGTDQMLVAGLFAQRQSADNTFTTKDASSLLLEQGYKVGNPSQSMTNNLKAKRVFKVGTSYRVSRAGIDYVTQLFGQSN
ncbi:MAG: hypothetical protein ABIR17_09040 [Pseudolysinimonas sp.]|uniref:hypothetical protein n=1 Tax=Pseudolysinimonas sp. TaxID=2680009 RepID=UPI0032679A38